MPRRSLNKADLTLAVSLAVDIPQERARDAVDVILATIADALARCEPVRVQGFGRFDVRERAPRRGRNPQTGEAMHLPAARVVSFSPGKALQEAVRLPAGDERVCVWPDGDWCRESELNEMSHKSDDYQFMPAQRFLVDNGS